MKIEDENNGNSYRVEFPELRAFGWAVWNILLGFCLGMAVHNFAVVLGG